MTCFPASAFTNFQPREWSVGRKQRFWLTLGSPKRTVINFLLVERMLYGSDVRSGEHVLLARFSMPDEAVAPARRPSKLRIGMASMACKTSGSECVKRREWSEERSEERGASGRGRRAR